MTCDHAIELLPWLLNGSLEAAERGEAWHHLETCESCRRALTETREAWSTFAQHLPSQDLVALAWGEAPSEAAEEHLASCARCAAELELARMSRRLEEADNIVPFPAARPRPAAGAVPWSRRLAVAAGLAAVVAASGWWHEARQANDFAAKLARAAAPPPAAAGTPARQPAGETPSTRERLAELEKKMEGLLGLQQETEKQMEAAQAQVARLEKEHERLAAPQASPMVDLGSGDVVRGETAGKTEVQGDRFNTLLVPARAGAASAEHGVEIENAAGKVVWRQDQAPVTQGYYAIVLPPGSLPRGRYTLRLSGHSESWTFQVVR
jgi:hypothetical protein